MLMEMSVVEQKYQAVLAVISDGRSVSEVAEQWGVSRQSVHTWLARYEADGLEGLRWPSSLVGQPRNANLARRHGFPDRADGANDPGPPPDRATAVGHKRAVSDQWREGA